MFLREITRVLQKLKFEGGQTEIPKPEFLQLTIGTMERKKGRNMTGCHPKMVRIFEKLEVYILVSPAWTLLHSLLNIRKQ